MKTLPFPLVLGTDLVQLSRFRRTNKDWLKKISGRILTRAEFRQTLDRFPLWHKYLMLPFSTVKENQIPEPKDADQFSRWLAGQWAAKEAARKAWGATVIGFKDVIVRRDHHGRPEVHCKPYFEANAPDSQSRSFESQRGLLSISHDGDYVTATVIASPLNDELEMFFAERGRKILDRDPSGAKPFIRPLLATGEDNRHSEGLLSSKGPASQEITPSTNS